MFYDVEKDTRPEIAPSSSPYGLFPRRFLRLTLYRLSVEDALRFSAVCCEKLNRAEASRMFRVPGSCGEFDTLFSHFTELVAWKMRKNGERELRFSINELLEEPFDLPGFPRNYYKQALLDEYERIASWLVPEGYVEQCDALAAGVPVEYIFQSPVTLGVSRAVYF